MKISEKQYNALPSHLRCLFSKLPNSGSDEVLAAFPDSNGSGAARTLKRGKRDGDGWGMADEPGELRDAGTGSAARFFYAAKASRADRDAGLEAFEKKRTGGMSATADGSMLTGSGNERTTSRANTHPTVKPTTLMQWLCRLITPPGGIILDPFMGSGSTGKAAVLEGFQFVGCEREDEYMPIATARIAWAIGAVSKEDKRPAVAPQQPAANDNDLFSVRAA